MPPGWGKGDGAQPEPKELRRGRAGAEGAPQKPVLSLLSNFRRSVFGERKAVG